MTAVNYFPTETWFRIANSAPHSEQRALLSVSRFLRQVAHRILFRTVTLEFGVWEHLQQSHVVEDVDMDDQERNMHRRTRELTSRVITDPAFAQAVQNLRICSCMRGDDFIDAQGE
jgi:hypothetical protein